MVPYCKNFFNVRKINNDRPLYCIINSVLLILILIILLTTIIYVYNPYYLMRPLQIVGDPGESMAESHAHNLELESIPRVFFDALKIENTLVNNFSFTSSSRLQFFLEGNGNCSQQATGLGVLLENQNMKYSIVHFIPKYGLFAGAGHSILQYEDEISFLVDPQFKSIPVILSNKEKKRVEFTSIETLRSKRITNIKAYSPQKLVLHDFPKYYNDTFAVAFARVDQKDLDKYFNRNRLLLKLLNLKETKLTRLIANGIAALTFNLPKFKITSIELKRFAICYPEFYWLRILAFSYIISIYSFIILSLVKFVIYLKDFIKDI